MGGCVGMRVVNSVQVFSMSFIRPIHISSATSSAFTFVILVIPTFTSIPPSSSSVGPVWSSCLVTCTSTLYTDSSGPCFHYPPLNILNPNSVLRPTIIVPAWPFKDRSPCRCPRLLLLPLFLLMADLLLPHHCCCCCLCELSAIRILRNLGNCGAIHVVPALLDGWLAGLPNPKE